MSVTEIVRDGIDCVFESFKELVVTADIVEVLDTYDPTTGVLSGSETTHTIDEVIFTNYERRRVDGQVIRSFDKLAIFRATDITVEITTEMVLTLAGKTWNIKNIDLDPSSSLYELQCRKP